MKIFKSLLFALMITLCLPMFVGCGSEKISVDGFQFTYKAKAEMTSENETKYLKISLEIKNMKNEENTLQASKFILKKGEDTISASAIIGNNIVDAMEEETFAKMATLDTTITLALSENLDGTYQLYYNSTKLFEINAQKINNNSSIDNENAN